MSKPRKIALGVIGAGRWGSKLIASAHETEGLFVHSVATMSGFVGLNDSNKNVAVRTPDEMFEDKDVLS